MVAAHRYAWELERGPIPPGIFVLHACDNPPCVRATHLFLGTNTDNIRDMHAKGRNTQSRPEMRGSKHFAAKLTEADVLEIRNLLAAGRTYRLIANAYGVNKSNIAHIARGRNWKWLTN